MSVIELMLAAVILVIGFTGALALVFMSISNNGRNKNDTTATLVAQMVIEQVNALPVNDTTTGTITINDCAAPANAWTINVTGAAAAPGSGANTTANGAIDFTQGYAAVPANYKMRYVTCDGRIYDVRWNVQQLTGAGATALTRLVTVSARPIIFANSNSIRLFAQPVTLRTIAGG